MRRVFILEQPRRPLNIEEASQWGSVEMLFTSDVRRPSIFETADYLQAVSTRLQEVNFDPSQDIFCIVGSMNNVNLAMLALATLFIGQTLTLLQYDSTTSCYRAVDVPLEGPVKAA